MHFSHSLLTGVGAGPLHMTSFKMTTQELVPGCMRICIEKKATK